MVPLPSPSSWAGAGGMVWVFRRTMKKQRYGFNVPLSMDMTVHSMRWPSSCNEQGRISEAISWYAQAADNGNQFASYQLGKLYLSGDGVPKDIPKAVAYLTDAAEQNNSQAQYVLGKLYLLGHVVEQDKEMAAQWFTLAVPQGHEYAQFFSCAHRAAA